MTLKSDAKFNEKLIYCFKNDKNLVNFDLNTQHYRDFHFDWFPLCEVYNLWPKKVQRNYISRHWTVMQNLEKKNDLWFGKWHVKFGECPRDHLKVSKLELWRDPFIQSREFTSSKFTKELCSIKMKNGAKFDVELTCRFKTDKRNLTNFDLSTRKSQKLHFSFWEKCIMFGLKKYWGVIFHDTEEWCKTEEKLTCDLEYDMSNMANIHQSTRKSQNWDSDGILLFKVENAWAWNIQRSYVSWKWRMMYSLKRKFDLWFQIWHEEFD